jgi:hypothetical protein
MEKRIEDILKKEDVKQFTTIVGNIPDPADALCQICTIASIDVS